MIPPTSSGTGYKPAPTGLQLARCVQVIDMGTQTPKNRKYPARRKVLLGFELPRCEREAKDGEESGCYIVWQNFTLSLFEKGKLRPFIETWRGKPLTEAEVATFNLKSLLGRVCQLLIAHNESDGNTYANIQTIVPADPEGFPEQRNENKYFFIDEFDQEAFDTFSDTLQGRIMRSPEYRARVGGVDQVFAEAAGGGGPTDEIPFVARDMEGL